MDKPILEQIREEMQRSYRPPQSNGASGPSETRQTSYIESAEIRSALAALHASYALVGQAPPEPPTWRGRVGARLVRLIQRLLFWYTPQIVHFQYSALQTFEELAKSLQGQQREGLAVLSRLDRLEGLPQALEELARNLQREQREGLAVLSRLDALERRIEGLRLQVVPRMERHLARLMEEVRNLQPGSLMEDQQDLDRLYAAFTDAFRGSREEIKERLAVYLPWLAKAGIGGAAMPVLDIGCGRGEWLELLQEHGLAGSGVDNNRVMVAACRELGLDVAEVDAIEHLHGLPEASLGAVTGFHIIEHLPLSRLLSLLDAAVRVLKPGGVAIFETPNPNNILVGSRNFYLDPTHQHPIPPLLGKFLAEARGLRRVEILELHPWPEASLIDVAAEGEVAARFNGSFYGPQDYAVIGWKA